MEQIGKLSRMKNYKTLSPKEQYLYDQIKSERGVFTFDDIYNLTNEKPYKILNNLKNKGFILGLKRGCFVLENAFIEEPYKISAELEKGVLAFISAWKMHGLLEYEPNTIYVLTSSESYVLEVLNYKIHYIDSKQKWGFENLEEVFVTDLEKTILDSLFKPQWSGGYPVIAESIFYSKINWKRLLSYLQYYDKKSLYQKLGYLLTLIKEKGKHIPDYVLRNLRKNIGNKVRLIPNPRLRYSYIKEWKIMDNLGRDHIMGGLNGA